MKKTVSASPRSLCSRTKFLFVLLTLLVLTGELAARFAIGLGTPPLVIEDETIEYMFRPNQDIYRFHNRQLFNRFGMRSEDFPEHKHDNELRVLVVGDSVVNGGSLTDQNELATTIVQHDLERDPRFNTITVGNISAGSWGPANQLAYLEKFGCFDADKIVFVLSSHDYSDVPTFAPLNPRTHPSSTPISALYEGIDRYLLKPAPWRSQRPHTIATAPPSEEVCEQHIQDLLSHASSSDATVAVIQYLNRQEIISGNVEDGYPQIHRICEELGVRTINNRAIFSDAIKKKQQPFRDKIHPNAYGQTLLAQLILEALQLDMTSTPQSD